MTEEQNQDFPEHWQEKTLGEILKVVRGVSFPSEDKKQSPQEDHIACLRTANVQETVDWDDLWYILEEHISREEQYVRENDILISTANSYELVGKVSLVRDLPERATLGAFISLIRVPEGLDSKFFFYQLRSTEVRNEMRQRASTTTNISNISTSDLNEVPLGVPPLSEQRRIVAKIEELFSNLDAGMGDLQTAEQQLERYRLSVLQAAVEGRLTADWRETHDPEPADQLLEQILEKRRELWEKQYRWERYDSKGKEPPSGWKDRYSEPVEPDLDNPEELPEGWTWAGLNAIYDWSNGDALPKKDREDGPYSVYGGNGITGHHNEYVVEEEVMVIGRVGANCGNVHLSDPKSWITDNAIYSKLKSPFVDHRFMVLQLRNKRLNQLAGGSGQPYLSQKKLNSVAVALPPLAEQKQIVDEVERLLSVADDASDTADREYTRAERLRQSILKQAFSGQLVPHDDEAAPPAIAENGSSTTGRSASDDGNPSSSSGEDVAAEELYDGTVDPDNQIEMDL